MKTSSTTFLKIVVVLMGLIVLAVCIFALPAGIQNDKTGYYKPILFGLYVPAIPFFIALYQAIKLLNYIDQNKAFSEFSLKALQNIKYCAISISILFTLGMPLIFNAGDKDDAPGAILIGLVIIFASIVIAIFATLLQKLMKSGLDIKSENDLTI